MGLAGLLSSKSVKVVLRVVPCGRKNASHGSFYKVI